MEEFADIENDVHLCPKCGKEIPFGTPYYSIVRSLENYSINPDSHEVEIEVKNAEEVISLCEACGSLFNQSALETILTCLPIQGHETRN